MNHIRKKWTQVISSAVLMTMIAAPLLSPLKLEAKGETAGSKAIGGSTAGSQSYEGEKNKMTDEQYAQFGLVNNSPEEFDPDDTDHPLEGYEPNYISELYVADMDRKDKWKGSFRVMNNADEVSDKAFNFNNMDDDLIGEEYDFKNIYPTNKDSKEVQTHNACAIDFDGDGTDEILDITLYVDKKSFSSSPKQRSCADVSLYDLDTATNKWIRAKSLTYELADSNTDDSCFVDGIEADRSKSYVSLSAWDIDGDGREEGAVYICSQTQGGKPYVIIVEGRGSIKENNLELRERSNLRISLEELNSENNTFTFKYKSWMMPIVNLATTKISGEEALVVNVSQPFKTNDGYGSKGQSSAMKIFHYDSGKDRLECRFTDDHMTYGNTRMRFSSAVDADLNGNGVEELIIGGYKNTGWKNNTDKGKMESGKNLVQMICWNNKSGMYEKVWDSPKEVEARSGLKISVEMLEPAAMTAGRLHAASRQDLLFLEGVVLKYSGSFTNGTTDTPEKELYQSGLFSKELSMDLGGSHNAFISTAHAAKFSGDANSQDQIVVLSGDHQATDDDYIYYDICWIYESNGRLVSKVTNDNYINHKNEDDNGTFICLCPLNVDEDTIYMDYLGKTCGWSDPTLYAVLQSPPYWSELDYKSEFSAGKVTYELSYGSGSGKEDEWGVGGSLFIRGSLVGGLNAFKNGVMIGGGAGLEGMAKYVNTHMSSNSTQDTFAISVAAGEDHAIVLAVPVVSYKYRMWVPEYVVSEDDIKNYETIRNEAIANGDKEAEKWPEEYTVEFLNNGQSTGVQYKLGDKVPGHWQSSSVQSTLSPSFATLTLEEYNELAGQYKDRGLNPVTSKNITGKTIGDPTTYPKEKEALYDYSQMEKLHMSRETANVQAGEMEHEFSYEMEKETEDTDGYEAEVDIELYAKIVAEMSIIAGSEAEGEAGFSLTGGGGSSWITTNSEGIQLSGSVSGFPEGTPSSYNYSAQMAVFNAKDLPKGGGDNTGAYVVGFVVKDMGVEVPPRLPVDLRVLGTTEHAAVLQWDAPDTYRPAKSYEVFMEDNVGHAESVGKTNDTYFIARNLNPAATYRFAVKSYAEEDQKGLSSAMSRWVTATTRDSTMYFTEQPKNVVVEPEKTARQQGAETTVQSKAEPKEQPKSEAAVQQGAENGSPSETEPKEHTKSEAAVQQGAENGSQPETESAEQSEQEPAEQSEPPETGGQPEPEAGVEPAEQSESHIMTAEAVVAEHPNAVIDYQWQKYSSKTLTGEGVWEDIAGETKTSYTLPAVTSENKDEYAPKTYYRVKAVYRDSGSAKSVISKTATMFVNESGAAVTYYDLDMNLEMSEGNIVYSETDPTSKNAYYYTYKGKNTGRPGTFTVKLKNADSSNASDIPAGETVYLMYYDESAGGKLTKLPGSDENANGSGVIGGDGTATFTVGDVPTGVYELFAVYPGSEAGGAAGQKHYLPAQSNSVTVHVTDSCKMEYHLNGGTSIAGNPSYLVHQGKAVAVDIKNPSRNGYTFEGWYMDEALANEAAREEPRMGEGYQTLRLGPDDMAADGSIHLYAKWTAAEYKITYHLNGGTNHPDNPSVYTIDGGRVVLKKASREDYIFQGWYKDEEMTKKTAFISNGSTGDVDLYAKWEEEPVPFKPDDTGKYQIATYEDLVSMARKVQSDPEKYASAAYVQVQNINCGEQNFDLPVGTEEHPFTGTYEGNDFYVLGLRQGSGVRNGGLFGVIGEGGTVKNLSVVDFDYSDWSNTAGGIAGINEGLIDGCGSGVNINSAATIFRDGKQVPITTLNSDVKGLACAGGIAGINRGEIRNSHSNAAVIGRIAGGIAGENSGVVRNIYNTGNVNGTKTAGGIVGENVTEGSVQYGYNSRAATVSTEGGAVGGIAGASGNGYLSDLWYPSDVPQVCGGQANESFPSVGAKTDAEMSAAAFRDILNTAIQDKRAEYGLGSWAWSASRNGGYPTVEYVLAEETTLTLSAPNFGLSISVSGKIHPQAALKFVRLSEEHADYLAMKEAVKSKKITEGWQLALQYEDGSYAAWNGDLKVRIRTENKERLKNLYLLRRNAEGAYQELQAAEQADEIEFVTDSLDHVGVMRQSDGKDEQGNPLLQPEDNGPDAAEGTQNPGNGGTDKKKTPGNAAKTGDTSRPVIFIILMLASGVVIAAIYRRNYRLSARRG